jgi:trimethylamine--corrinoid protein Co-methyltransferase
LQHTDEELTNVLWAIEHDVPVIYIGGGTAGSSAPITGAGLMVIYLAGALSGLAICHLKKRGARVCIGGVPEPADMRTGRPAYGGPETSLYSAAMSDISRYLGLPFMGTAGASESKLVDLQAAIESTIQVVLSGLSGATLVHDVGFLDCADIGSLEMLVMTDEIIAMTRRIMRGVEISDETLMLDLIDRVGPGGEFLSAKETAKLCRSEIWTPGLLDRDPWVTWEAGGAASMNDRIRARIQKILAEHQSPPLSADAAARIEAILQAARQRVEGK